jgi:hypothetical protein
MSRDNLTDATSRLDFFFGKDKKNRPVGSQNRAPAVLLLIQGSRFRGEVVRVIG